jgi:hypothetical protein
MQSLTGSYRAMDYVLTSPRQFAVVPLIRLGQQISSVTILLACERELGALLGYSALKTEFYGYVIPHCDFLCCSRQADFNLSSSAEKKHSDRLSR